MPKIVKNTTFPGLFDLLAPYSCRGCGSTGDVLCERCKNNIVRAHFNFCPKCKNKLHARTCPHCDDLPPTFIVNERQTLIGELVHDFKYSSTKALARPLAEILDSILPTFPGQVIIVPLPTIAKHIRKRGLDHTYQIAKHLAKIRGNSYKVQKILTRNNSSVQVGSSKKDRLAQASSAYKINPKYNLNSDTLYLLLDDVWTTGASMEFATKMLQHAGASKIGLVILAVSRLD